MRLAHERSPSSGFTLIEVAISSVILGIVGYSVSLALKMGQDSHTTVAQVSSESRATRNSVASLVDDVRASSNARITATTAADGNSSVRLQQPIEVGGALVWGVRDRRLGDSETTWNRQDWFVEYSVDGQRRLVRRLIDTDGLTRLEDVLATDLRDGGAGAPGFTMAQVGDVWEVSLALRHGVHGEGVYSNDFHVRARN